MRKEIKNPPIIQNNDILYDFKIIANAFNDYFINLFKTPSTIDPSFKNFLKTANSNSFFLQYTDSNEIFHFAKTSLNSKCLDSQILSNKTLKIILPSISNVVTFLFNKVISSGIFPDSLKIARIIPIHKSGSLNDISNYKLVSIISCFSKLLEKIIKFKLDEFLSLKMD